MSKAVEAIQKLSSEHGPQFKDALQYFKDAAQARKDATRSNPDGGTDQDETVNKVFRDKLDKMNIPEFSAKILPVLNDSQKRKALVKVLVRDTEPLSLPQTIEVIIETTPEPEDPKLIRIDRSFLGPKLPSTSPYASVRQLKNAILSAVANIDTPDVEGEQPKLMLNGDVLDDDAWWQWSSRDENFSPGGDSELRLMIPTTHIQPQSPPPAQFLGKVVHSTTSQKTPQLSSPDTSIVVTVTMPGSEGRQVTIDRTNSVAQIEESGCGQAETKLPDSSPVHELVDAIVSKVGIQNEDREKRFMLVRDTEILEDDQHWVWSRALYPQQGHLYLKRKHVSWTEFLDELDVDKKEKGTSHGFIISHWSIFSHLILRWGVY